MVASDSDSQPPQPNLARRIPGYRRVFKALERQEYNYFVEPDGHDGPVPELLTLRVTDIYGATLSDSGIALVAESETPWSAQFPVRP
jgi:expansin (peptidoglycan-binding protein)